MSRLTKRLFASPWFIGLLARLLAASIRILYWTNRWQVENPGLWAQVGQGGPVIICGWHGRIMMLANFWASDHRPVHVVASAHRDGRLIAETVRQFGVRIVTGSSSRGGASALRTVIELLRQGQAVGITPDGPRGPGMRAKAGAIAAARATGAPVVAITYATSRRRLLGSWDRFHLTWPFGRGVFLVAKPFYVTGDQEDAYWCRQLEQQLNELTAEADRRVGHPPLLLGETEGSA